MRPKFLIATMLGALLLFGLFYLARKPTSELINPEKGALTQDTLSANPTGGTKTDPVTPEIATSKSVQQPPPDKENTPETQHEAYVAKRIEELMDLATNDDPNSLNAILSELPNRDPEIRKAAREAAVQFGSRDAIPKLMDLVSQVDDPIEKADILEAIEFLKLPSATEVIAQGSGRKVPAQRTSSFRPANRP